MIKKVNLEIALTHILTRKRQTIIAALGVTIGIGMYIFVNSMMAGFGRYSKNEMFKTSPHIKIYKEENSNATLQSNDDPKDNIRVVVNPTVTSESNTLLNPQKLLNDIRQMDFVTQAAPQVNVDAFYNKGDLQVKGIANGIVVAEANEMFKISETVLSGSIEALNGNINGILIGKGVSEKLGLRLGDNLTISSSRNVTKNMQIVGIFSTGNKLSDETKSYINIATAQALMQESPSFVTNIYVNTPNPDDAPKYAQELQSLTSYKVEDWQTTNADMLAGDKIRDIMGTLVPMVIMLVAAFGIYNILNMIVSQKLNDIAILKATGFNSRDIIQIFLSESIIMGLLGVILGLGIGAVAISLLSKVYVGGAIGNFPIYFKPSVFIIGGSLGVIITTLAGYFPARRASSVDPVAIFRK
jgi:lipoprotein-releasing system permease protein